ncbi:hypothetical protein TR51_17805 [Kitasatospora griseola]|uniref:DUF1877 family protein n=1 Tax=Kitasatospora griseola TaxID=2064 RepID=A0A0D0Q3Z9_KITGR|nr:hypothetical protein [Kitasatospora griseola]KIQ65658.1 hypothetical protein TR51_17805 [Kitasatospora griseola]
MSIVIKFFGAPDHEAAAAVVQRGPDGVFESLAYGNFDAEEALIEWESIFTGRSFEELVAADLPEVVADQGAGEGPMVLAASRALRDALAAADEPRLVEVSQLWVQERAADGEVLDRQVATEILGILAGLARAVGGRQERLYCWMA